ncbi:hypothetical protein KIPB_002888 [Kipferlia bialata]|uniref:Uncharacterized protein n=1 Tax=Kipferlia bialata TaxID=797122 RepID=A0A9K3GGR2_9EUKA|nr:hypothetical protein KIPB_002888 [Kipferlia bialata]|eukprot:g2888.t1
MLTQETDDYDPVCDVHYTLPITDADALTYFLMMVAQGIVVLARSWDVTEKQRKWVYKHFRAGEALLERISSDEVELVKDRVVQLGLVGGDFIHRYNAAIEKYGTCPDDYEGRGWYWTKVYRTFQDEVWEAFDELMLDSSLD